MNGPVVGTAWFSSLPKELQAILREEAFKAGEWTTEKVLSSESTMEAMMVSEHGVVITEPDLEAFRKAAGAAYEALGLVELKAEVDNILSGE